MSGIASEVRRLTVPLTEGLRVRHIAHFGLFTCKEQDEPTEVLKRQDLADYDQIPITSARRIVGVLERHARFRRKLDDSLLVSADESLVGFITSLERQPYRLVLDGTAITGIVTRSDLLKAPVFVLAYSLIAQLEMLMNAAIRRLYGDSDSWLPLLSGGARKLIEGRRRSLQDENLVLSSLELADFAHKAILIRDLLPADRSFKCDFEKLKKLRNDVAHVHEIVRTDAELHSLIDRMETMTVWIGILAKYDDADRSAIAAEAHA